MYSEITEIVVAESTDTAPYSEEWQMASKHAYVAALRIPPAEWGSESKVRHPSDVPVGFTYAHQHFMNVGAYKKREVILGADGRLYLPSQPDRFMRLGPDTFKAKTLATLSSDLSRFYKMSDEHDALYVAIREEQLRIATRPLLQSAEARYYADVHVAIRRLNDGCKHRKDRDGTKVHYNHLRLSNTSVCGYRLDEKGRIVAYSRYHGGLTVVEPCEIFELSVLRAVHTTLHSIR